MTVRLMRWGVIGLLLCLWVGCGQENPLNRQSLSGTVKLKGEPVAKGTIQFMPTQGTGTIAGGNIENGAYSIAAEGGLAPGEYAVMIHVPDPNWDAKKSLNPAEMAPTAYARGTKRVKVGTETNNFDFDM